MATIGGTGGAAKYPAKICQQKYGGQRIRRSRPLISHNSAAGGENAGMHINPPAIAGYRCGRNPADAILQTPLQTHMARASQTILEYRRRGGANADRGDSFQLGGDGGRQRTSSARRSSASRSAGAGSGQESHRTSLGGGAGQSDAPSRRLI